MKILLISAAIGAAFQSLPAAAQAMSAPGYVAAAGAGDLYEITASKMVRMTTHNAKLREFADMMVTDHMKSTAAVKSAAAQAGVMAPPPKLTAPQRQMISELRTKHGKARDTAYIAQQMTAHGQALDLQKGYAMNGTEPALKSAAAMIVPVVEQHISMLQAMSPN